MLKNKLKKALAITMTLVMGISLTVTSYAASTIKTTKTQNTNIYSMYTSFNYTEGSLWWKKTHKANFYAKFSKGYIIQLKNLSHTYEWNGSKDYRNSLTLQISKSMTVSETNSWSLTGELGFKVPVKVVEIAGKLGGSYSSEKTFSGMDACSSENILDKTAPKGYYALVAALKADLFNIEVTEGSKSLGTGKLLKYSTNKPYIMLRYDTRDFD